MSLAEYRNKRDFRRTKEPRGGQSRSPGGQFVVQKHAARRLHYDFRLELDGVLKSWAVPKGPSLDPSVRSLAVHVEDHPLEYGSFEGVIPKGEYGGGTVMLWDRGSWHPHGDPAKAYKKGKLRFRLEGEKLKGEWALVQMHGRAGDDGKNWLLKKVEDDEARPGEGDEFLAAHDQSVKTKRSMKQIAGEEKAKSGAANGAAVEREEVEWSPATTIDIASIPGAKHVQHLPRSFRPQLATLVKAAPDGDEWLHELKLDGYRLLALIGNRTPRLYTRRGKDWTDRFANVAAALQQLDLRNTILDGEIVVMAKDGTTDFQALQNSMQHGRDKDLVYYAFDLPYYDGYDLTRVPLVERKAVLAQILGQGSTEGTLRYSDHIRGQGGAVAKRACRHGLEGVICKRADSPYEQRRSDNWVKVKCLKRQEFVVGGWTEPGGSRKGFGALLAGYYERTGRLVYCGRVGTGFNRDSLRQVHAELQQLERESAPFSNPPTGAQARGVHWVHPRLVAEVEFSAWTDDGILRHPSFQGLREDKVPREIQREEPVAERVNGTTAQRSSKKPSDSGTIAGVRLSNPDRVLYPQQNVTKLDLARYYESVADAILPSLVDRPLSLVRCPRGREQKCFFQKHVNESVPDAVDGIEVQEKDGKAVYVAVSDLSGLITLVQLGVLEIHPWGSRKDRLDRPDQMIFDLDPAEDVRWETVVDAAREVRQRLGDLGLDSFVRTTGGKGLHVVVPLVRRHPWAEMKAFAKAFADRIVSDHRDRYIATASKARRAGKIFIDYLRNDRGSTAIGNYSTRARVGATVATPIRWDELSAQLNPASFNVESVPRRLAALQSDPWQGFSDTRQSITKAMQKQLGL